MVSGVGGSSGRVRIRTRGESISSQFTVVWTLDARTTHMEALVIRRITREHRTPHSIEVWRWRSRGTIVGFHNIAPALHPRALQ
jgi:hypothetical protein